MTWYKDKLAWKTANPEVMALASTGFQIVLEDVRRPISMLVETLRQAQRIQEMMRFAGEPIVDPRELLRRRIEYAALNRARGWIYCPALQSTRIGVRPLGILGEHAVVDNGVHYDTAVGNVESIAHMKDVARVDLDPQDVFRIA